MTTSEKASSPLRIAVTGATGLIGRHLVEHLRATGHTPLPMRRGKAGGEEAQWDPAAGGVALPGGADVLVHLAGRNVATRWTRKAKAEIRNSRVHATRMLAAGIAAMPPPLRPKLLISTSAIGIYGDRGDELLTEASEIAKPGASFLSDVCRGWEEATHVAQDAGIRVIHVRLGVVLSRDGGALAKLVTPTKFGLGGPVGTGLQWMSWISLLDVVRLLTWLAEGEQSAGVLNAVAPTPVRQHEFIRTLGHILHRPTVFPLPSFAVKIAFGQMGQEVLLYSQRVAMARQPDGFTFATPTLHETLQRELGRA
jgi:uncharacterized protein (TIGR01777 family)